MTAIPSTDLSLYAGAAINGMLQTPEVQTLWERYHASEKNRNPAHGIVEEIKTANGDFRSNPALLAFMRRLVDIEYGAASKSTKDKDAQELRQSLKGLRDYLDLQALDVELPKIKKLPKNHQNLLRAIEHHTAQGGWGPFYTMRKILRDTVHHVKEEVKENPKSSAALAGVGLVLAIFMTVRMGNSAVNYIEPEALKTNNFSMDALLDPSYIPTKTDTLLVTANKLNVHSHLNQILQGFGFSEDRAVEITQNINIPAFLHYDRIKTGAIDAQNSMNSMYDWWNTRIQWFTEDTSIALSRQLFQESPFKRAFDLGAHYTAEGWYALNTYENFVFHLLVTFAGGVITYRSLVNPNGQKKSFENEELKEHANEVKDFAARSWLNSSLSYTFAASGAVYGWVSHEEHLPWAVLMGVGGMLLGEGAHRLVRAFNKSSHTEKATLDVRENLARFSDPSVITFNQHVTSDIKHPNWAQRLWKQKRTIAVAAGLSALSAADIMFNEGVLTGYAGGGLLVTTKFLAFNAVEDTGAHLIFGVLGSSIGLVAVGMTLTIKGGIYVSKTALDLLSEHIKDIKALYLGKPKHTPKVVLEEEKKQGLSCVFADTDVCAGRACAPRNTAHVTAGAGNQVSIREEQKPVAGIK